MGLLSEREQSELAKLADLHGERDRIEDAAPKLEFQADSLHKSLVEEYGDADILSLGDSLFLDEIIRRLQAERNVVNEQFAKVIDEAAFLDAQKQHTRAVEARARAEAHVQNLEGHLEQAEGALAVARHNPSQMEQAEYFGGIPALNGMCSVDLQSAADTGCPIAKLKLKNTVDFAARNVENATKTSAENIEDVVEGRRKQLSNAKRALAESQNEEKECEDTIQAFAEQRQATLQIQKRATERISRLDWIAHRARAAHDSAQEARQRIASLTTEIDETRKTAEAIREGLKRAMSDFSGSFNRVIAALIGEDVTAGASFHGRAVHVNLTCRGDFTSAAIETIKILAFDLSVLLSSIEGRGHHPRFLIHDGPREADMSAAIYRRFFVLAREFERAAGGLEPNFQYIITTTEPPPDEICQTPWLLDPVLDASTNNGRLLKVDL